MYAQPQPDYPAALSSLQGMTSDQLKEILNRFLIRLNPFVDIRYF